MVMRHSQDRDSQPQLSCRGGRGTATCRCSRLSCRSPAARSPPARTPSPTPPLLRLRLPFSVPTYLGRGAG
uniref:QQT1 n=1 Tax=Arundo donax TaxID=35708 RepID=A0A0A9E3B8_ARUDO